jgi:hypothetical protein
MRIARLGILIGVVVCALGASSTQSSLECGRNLVVHFPAVSLAAGERVVGMKLAVVGGSVVSVESIPRGWHISVEPEASNVAYASGNTRHGAGALESTEALPVVTVHGQNCAPRLPSFALKAAVSVSRGFASSRTIQIDQRKLKIQ